MLYGSDLLTENGEDQILLSQQWFVRLADNLVDTAADTVAYDSRFMHLAADDNGDTVDLSGPAGGEPQADVLAAHRPAAFIHSLHTVMPMKAVSDTDHNFRLQGLSVRD